MNSSHLCQFCEKVCLNGFLDCGHNSHPNCLEIHKYCMYCQSMSQIQSNIEPISNLGPIPKTKRVRKKKVPEILEVSCSICIEDIKKKTKVFCYPCGHVFHDKCAKKWNNVTESVSCPNKCPIS
jgi:hypothetical protein